MSEHYNPPLDDLNFLLREVIRTDLILDSAHYEHVDLDIASAIIEQGGKFAADVLAPLNAVGDRVGSKLVDGRVVTPPGFKEAYQRLADGGWIGIDLPEEHGGQGLPTLLQVAMAEMVTGSCLAFSMLPLMARAASRLLISHGEADLRDCIVPRLIAGEWTATICISEPQAGSDVGRISTRAVPSEDRSFQLTGNKIFVTFGDHDIADQIIHMVLAREPGAEAGTRGLSLFVVPKFNFSTNGRLGDVNSAKVSHVETKMGLKASPTCILNLDQATGYRVGEPGRGLKTLFEMVNMMRMEVGVQGVGVAGAVTAKALGHAAERVQGGAPDRPAPPLIRHADVRRMLFVMQARTEAMRALMLETALQLDLSRTVADEQARAMASRRAQLMLPLCKAFFSEAGFEVANLGMQIFGGYGYITETGVEQYVRDIRVAAIYEGSNGIQALDLVVRKLLGDSGKSYREFVDCIQADIERCQHNPEICGIRNALIDAVQRLEHVTENYLALDRGQRRDAETGATAYLNLLGRVASGWMWLRMAATACGDKPLHRRKRALAQFYGAYLMPEVEALQKQALAKAVWVDVLNDQLLMK